MKQKTFTFKKYGKIEFWNKDDFPFGEDSAKEEFKRRYLKAGYLVKDVKAQMVMIATGYLAPARNLKKSEREKMQQEVEKLKPNAVIKLAM